ncbi:MAG: hypothetical protein GTO18_17760 [Anaerolineales bacterium]|nr:hypothetical protein [Anaerolineales bacterium]
MNEQNSLRSRILKPVFAFLFSLLTRVEVSGVENIPENETYIFATNHLSAFDIPLLYSIMGNDRIRAWVADKYQFHPFFGPFTRLGNPIFVNRGEVDRNALDAAVDSLRDGYIFGLAPEGTRSRTGTLLRGKTGIAYLADKSDAPILLCAIAGSENISRDLPRLRRPRLTVTFAKPFHLPPLDPDNRASSMRRNTDEVMCRIAAMLPEKYHGYYADHPRLNELLEESD